MEMWSNTEKFFFYFGIYTFFTSSSSQRGQTMVLCQFQNQKFTEFAMVCAGAGFAAGAAAEQSGVLPTEQRSVKLP
jgi:hypothetical protein